MHGRDDSDNQLARQKSVCCNKGNLGSQPVGLGKGLSAIHTHPAQLIQPVIHERMGTHFGHATVLSAMDVSGLGTYRLLALA